MSRKQIAIAGAWLVFVSVVMGQWCAFGLFVFPLNGFYVGLALVAAIGLFREHPAAIAFMEVGAYVSIVVMGCPPPDQAHRFADLTDRSLWAGVTSSWFSLTVMAVAMRYVRRTSETKPSPRAQA